MTASYFDGTWSYWTPLTRFYYQTLEFDYYYGEYRRREQEAYLLDKSVFYYNYTQTEEY